MEDVERQRRIAGHVREILELLGVRPDVDRETANTPERVAELAVELTAGLAEPPSLGVLEDADVGRGLVIVRGLELHSICVHHLLPFFGAAHIGYVPSSGVVGIGALGRVLNHFSRRPQLQERLGEQVVDYVMREASAAGAIVVLEARQLCMEMRGARSSGLVQTTAARGVLADGPLRAEFFDRIGIGRREGSRE